MVEYSAYGRLLEREGNRSPYCAPQGLYACEGEDNWLALSIASDTQWQALVDVMDRPAWAMDPRFATHAGRRAAHDEIDKELASWAGRHELHSLIDGLLAAGVPAAALLDSQAAYKHPQMAARGFFETVDHPVAGSHPMPGLPFRFASRDGQPWLQQPAPTLGQHNREVLSELLGLGESELGELEAVALTAG